MARHAAALAVSAVLCLVLAGFALLLMPAASTGDPDRNLVPRINSFTASPSSAYTTLPVTFTGNASDPLGYGLRWDWDFQGDGIIDRSYTTDPTFPLEPVIRQEVFLYTVAGSYRPRLNITNLPPPGGVSRTVSVSITVVIALNHAPELAPIEVLPSDQTARVGGAFGFSSTAVDSDGDACAYRWEFGDGANVSGILAGTTDPQALGASHAYAFAGEYVVTLVLDDGKSGIASAAVLVTVLPPPSIEVDVLSPWGAIAPGEMTQVTVTAQSGGQPLPDASVFLTSDSGGTLNPTSGTTDASGVITSNLWVDFVPDCTVITVYASVTKPGYLPSSGSLALTVVSPTGFYFPIYGDRREMMSYEVARFRVVLTFCDAGIVGAKIETSSPLGGVFSPVSDLGNGTYAFEWLAPKVNVQTFAPINVIASALGFYSASSRYVILVDPNRTSPTDPSQLFLLVRADASSVRPGGTVNFTVYAYTVEGFAVSGATVVVSVRSSLGTVTAVLDRLNGVYTFTFTASSDVTYTGVLIGIQASKDGYAPATARSGILITG